MRSLKYFKERVAVKSILRVKEQKAELRRERRNLINEKPYMGSDESIKAHRRLMKIDRLLESKNNVEYTMFRYLYNRLGEGEFTLGEFVVRISKGSVVSVEVLEHNG